MGAAKRALKDSQPEHLRRLRWSTFPQRADIMSRIKAASPWSTFTWSRWASGVLLLGAAIIASLVSDYRLLALAVPCGFGVHTFARRSLSKSLHAAIPVVLFAATLTLLQVIVRMPVTLLAAQAVAVFLFVSAAFRIVPWAASVARISPHSRLFAFALYALFTRHFFFILTGEAMRLFRARSQCIIRPYGKGAFRSLAAALASLFSRSLLRAERFYAAQLLRGLAE